MPGEVIYKMTGSGNDFVFVDGRNSPLACWPGERIRRICARGTGVGADGFVVLDAGSGPGRVRFHFFNSDGERADMCGNGALCATRLAAWLELAPPDGMVLETDAGRLVSRCVEGHPMLAEIDLPVPAEVTQPAIALCPGERAVALARVGVPHLVVWVDDLERVKVVERGRQLRFDPALGSAGANVNFVANGESRWSMRTYERGVEAETLACGTGAAAAAYVLARAGALNLPCEFGTASGASLRVGLMEGAGGDEVLRLRGEGRLVFRAILEGV